jgi:SAM-dependent methyltransferase
VSDETTKAIRDRWNRQQKPTSTVRARWWKSRTVWLHVNRIGYGLKDDSRFGLHSWLISQLPDAPFKRGLSIGCGIAAKEFNLLKLGLVERFDLYDLSTARRDQAMEDAAREGLTDRITFRTTDAFETAPEEEYDFVYWHAALHHMFDVPAAVAWSHRALRRGGVFAFNEYVGPSRFQWPEADVEIAQIARDSIPRSVRLTAKEGGIKLKPTVWRPTEAEMIAHDPSESVDSARILPAIEAQFQDRTIRPLGGLIYMMALGNAVSYAKGEKEQRWLRDWLHVDWGLAMAGRTYFAAGICRK